MQTKYIDMSRNSLDNDFEYQNKVEEVQQDLMVAIQERDDTVSNLIDILERVSDSAFGGGYDGRNYEKGHNTIDKLEEKINNNTISCDTTRMSTAIDKARQVLDHYKAINSFEAKSEDETCDVNAGLTF